jgi:hypothetical protein
MKNLMILVLASTSLIAAIWMTMAAPAVASLA